MPTGSPTARAASGQGEAWSRARSFGVELPLVRAEAVRDDVRRGHGLVEDRRALLLVDEAMYPRNRTLYDARLGPILEEAGSLEESIAVMTDIRPPAFALSIYDGEVARERLDVVRGLYAEVYAEPPYCEGADDVDSFVRDWPRRVEQPAFRLVVARAGEEAVGFAFGHPLTEKTRWWEGALEPLSPDLAAERRGRTFAIIELAVRRPEARPARGLYAALGYRNIGRLRPYEGAPVYDAMVRQLGDPEAGANST
jgi:hypothetical protein